MNEIRTYVMVVDYLDIDEVVFRMRGDRTSLTVSRADWEVGGRPQSLEVTVSPVVVAA